MFLAVVVTLTRGWASVGQTFATPRTRWLLLAAAVLVSLNWTGYIWAVNNAHVVEASLGYFINPLVSVLIGVVVLRERLRPVQWVAVGIAGVAVVVLTADYGRPPWIALLLAMTFATYGLTKKFANVPAIPSLTVETAYLAPVALAFLAWLAISGTGLFSRDLGTSLLLAGSGVVTALPLLAFGAAAIRIPLSALGILQYITPVMQFLLGVLLFHEVLSGVAWFGFMMIWIALVIFSVDAFRVAAKSASAKSAGAKSAGAKSARANFAGAKSARANSVGAQTVDAEAGGSDSTKS